MKKISLYLLMILATGMFTSCGDDEPEITRVQDGNGKVFLETGTLVDANLNFSEAELEQALSTYKWEREYSFYYDNQTISNRYEVKGLPTVMHPDGTIELESLSGEASTSHYVVRDKHIYVTSEPEAWSDTYYSIDAMKVVSLDLTEGAGRMITDRIAPKGYGKSDNYNTTYIRMVWRAVMQ